MKKNCSQIIVGQPTSNQKRTKQRKIGEQNITQEKWDRATCFNLIASNSSVSEIRIALLKMIFCFSSIRHNFNDLLIYTSRHHQVSGIILIRFLSLHHPNSDSIMKSYHYQVSNKYLGGTISLGWIKRWCYWSNLYMDCVLFTLIQFWLKHCRQTDWRTDKTKRLLLIQLDRRDAWVHLEITKLCKWQKQNINHTFAVVYREKIEESIIFCVYTYILNQSWIHFFIHF